MRVAVIGTGYVGLTTALSLAYLGHEVVGVDLDEAVPGAETVSIAHRDTFPSRPDFSQVRAAWGSSGTFRTGPEGGFSAGLESAV